VYVSSTDSGTVKVISTDTDTVTASITVGAKPAGLTMTPDGKYVVAAVNGANSAEVIDTSTDAVVNKVVVPFAHSSCVSADSHFAYVGSQAPNAPAIIVVDITSTTAAPISYPVDKSPRALGCAAANKVFFTAAGVDALEVMDSSTGKVGTPITTGGSPHDTRPTNDGKFELIVSQTAGDLEMIDQASSTVAAKVPTGKMPHWIALTSGGGGAYVTNEGDNNVVLVDLDTRSVVTTIPVGNAPRKIAIQH
jgi:YVTN family beta-propeller protein